MITKTGLCSLTLLLALIVSSCSTADHRPARGRAGSSTPDQRVAAGILRAEDRRQVDDSLREALRHSSPPVRASAALAVGRIASDDAAAILTPALDDAAAEVRAAAVFGLGLLRRAELVVPLQHAASDAEPVVRAAAATGLGLLPASTETVLRLLADESEDVALAACHSAAAFERGGFAVERLIELTRADSARLAESATYALARLTGQAGRLSSTERELARKRLGELRLARDWTTRLFVAQGLAIPSQGQEASWLGQLLDDRDPRVRAAAVRSLCFPGAPIEPFVTKALADRSNHVVLSAVEGLGRMKGPDIVNRLVELLAKDARLWVREAAVDSLGRVDPDLAAKIANGLSKDEHFAIRAAAGRLLVGRHDAEALEIAARLATDTDPRVRALGVRALALADGTLGELLGDAPVAPAVIVRAAVAEAARVRLEDLRASAAAKDEALRLLEQLWIGAASDPMTTVPLKVAEALTVAGAGAEKLLRDVLASPHEPLRRLAASRLSELGLAVPAGTPGPVTDLGLDHYIDILRWAGRPRAAVVTVERPGFVPGRFTLVLDAAAAPLTAWNFARLAESGFYDGLILYRVIPNFVVQDGDPMGNGDGGPGYFIRDEPGLVSFAAGTLGMASTGRDMAGSQWFVTLAPQPHLVGRYTAFGRVVQNFHGVVSLLEPGDRVLSIRIYQGDGSEALPDQRF